MAVVPGRAARKNLVRRQILQIVYNCNDFVFRWHRQTLETLKTIIEAFPRKYFQVRVDGYEASILCVLTPLNIYPRGKEARLGLQEDSRTLSVPPPTIYCWLKGEVKRGSSSRSQLPLKGISPTS